MAGLCKRPCSSFEEEHHTGCHRPPRRQLLWKTKQRFPPTAQRHGTRLAAVMVRLLLRALGIQMLLCNAVCISVQTAVAYCWCLPLESWAPWHLPAIEDQSWPSVELRLSGVQGAPEPLRRLKIREKRLPIQERTTSFQLTPWYVGWAPSPSRARVETKRALLARLWDWKGLLGFRFWVSFQNTEDFST